MPRVTHQPVHSASSRPPRDCPAVLPAVELREETDIARAVAGLVTAACPLLVLRPVAASPRQYWSQGVSGLGYAADMAGEIAHRAGAGSAGRRVEGHLYLSLLEVLGADVAGDTVEWNSPRYIASLRARVEQWLGSPWPQSAVEQVLAVRGIWAKGGYVLQAMPLTLGTEGGLILLTTRDPLTGRGPWRAECALDTLGLEWARGERLMGPMGLRISGRLGAAEACGALAESLERENLRPMRAMLALREGSIAQLASWPLSLTSEGSVHAQVEMARQRRITRSQAVAGTDIASVERLIQPTLVVGDSAPLFAGLPAAPGVGNGKLAFSAGEAVRRAASGEAVILVVPETQPADVGAMRVVEGIITSTGGMTSHAAIVARGLGVPCVAGVGELRLSPIPGELRIGTRLLGRGDWLAMDGGTGRVYDGSKPVMPAKPSGALRRLLAWADRCARLKVRANADSGEDARVARVLGATGIGLCRTEHMFFSTPRRRLAFQAMILADTPSGRVKASSDLLAFQRGDFVSIFREMRSLPVTIRLLDPPLHEFLPRTAVAIAAVAAALGVPADWVAARCEQLREANPMLVHRGSRLCMTHPELLEMQVTAIIQAAIACTRSGLKVAPEILLPMVMDPVETSVLVEHIRRVADRLLSRARLKVACQVGATIEVPRAALLADRIARACDFFSFGTNDLTQTTLGLSRDDCGSFMAVYTSSEAEGGKAILPADPFAHVDEPGVGMLVELGLALGRSARRDLVAGLCGEQGGSADGVAFCHRIGLNYVSCSPYRLPIARLAAAQAALGERGLNG